MKPRILIGRQDLADFPKLQLDKVEVKIDTGAYTSSFHCHDIEVITLNGTKKLRCFFLDPNHEKYHHKEFIFDRFSLKKVRSSNGQMEERYSIQTSIRLFEQEIPLELTLTERGVITSYSIHYTKLYDTEQPVPGREASSFDEIVLRASRAAINR